MNITCLFGTLKVLHINNDFRAWNDLDEERARRRRKDAICKWPRDEWSTLWRKGQIGEGWRIL